MFPKLRPSLSWLCASVAIVVACVSTDDADTAPTTSASSGSGASGGGQTADDASSTSGPTEPECPYTGPPVLDPSTLTACPSCGGGHCVPKTLVPPEQQQQLAECEDTSTMCVPDKFIETGGNFIPDKCESVFGAEGRCLSTCLPKIASQAAQLPQATCPDEHVCAPCFDPFDGSPTGACELSCDPGPTTEPVELPRCCNDIGTCVPTSAIPAEQASQLGEDTCAQDQAPTSCVPDVFLQQPYKPTPCETGLISALLGDAFKPGACIPDCVPAVQGTINNIALGQDGCADHNLCAPCLDPLSGEPSGACDGMGCDGFCGAQSGEGCWCDPGCVMYGDCCADACMTCGAC